MFLCALLQSVVNNSLNTCLFLFEDGVDNNTHQNEPQGYPSYEHGNIKQENETKYERRSLDQERPVLHSGNVHFKVGLISKTL